MNVFKVLSIGLLALSSACAAPPNNVKVDVAPKPAVNFIDVANFDAELASSLNAPFDSVEVFFYEKISPNKMPERLQKWISAVERSGGTVKINTPPNEPTPKSPLALLGLLGTAYTTIKSFVDAQPASYLSSAKGRNAVISLARSPNGDLLVEKIGFVK
jgi:hypothetical protein